MLHDLSLENKVIWLKALMIECPLYSALPECPLAKYRSKPISERFHHVDHMGEELVDSIIDHHERCLSLREQRATVKD
ncbi:MAG: hypothetical protein H8E18_02340 [FCB group bacterium]|nr:hypothetical protein [FCB group bacterium]